MVKRRIQKRIRKEILRFVDALKADKLPIKKVILFGSYAKGTQHKWSDIDVCILSPKFKDSFQANEYLWSKRTFSDPKYVIEPHGFHPKEISDPYSTLMTEIRTTGIEIPV